MKGRVDWWASSLGYGFIISENNERIFVHFTEIVDNENDFKYLNKWDEVEFEEIEDEKGKKAKNVVIIKRCSRAKRFREEGYIRWSFSKEIVINKSKKDKKEIKYKDMSEFF